MSVRHDTTNAKGWMGGFRSPVMASLGSSRGGHGAVRGTRLRINDEESARPSGAGAYRTAADSAARCALMRIERAASFFPPDVIYGACKPSFCHLSLARRSREARPIQVGLFADFCTAVSPPVRQHACLRMPAHVSPVPHMPGARICLGPAHVSSPHMSRAVGAGAEAASTLPCWAPAFLG